MGFVKSYQDLRESEVSRKSETNLNKTNKRESRRKNGGKCENFRQRLTSTTCNIAPALKDLNLGSRVYLVTRYFELNTQKYTDSICVFWSVQLKIACLRYIQESGNFNEFTNERKPILAYA